MRLTIAAVPKQFEGHIGLIQANAVRSWRALPCEPQILLLGGEAGVGGLAREVGATSVDAIARDEFGTPLLDAVFGEIARLATGDVIAYVNADIILTSEIVPALATTRAAFGRFLLVAKRWNLDVEEPIDFTSPLWEAQLKSRARTQGALFAPQAIDIFGFAKGQFAQVPAFAVGRSYWDNWFIASARHTGIPVVDATGSAMIIHQNHAYKGFQSLAEIRCAPQGRRNFHRLGDSHYYLGTTRDATHELRDGVVERTATKTVSVVIPHAGPLAPLKACLRALTFQTYPRTFIDVVVTCNDPVCDIGIVGAEFPFVRICTELKAGPAAARNTGAACAKGEVLAFLDSDCVPTKDWIEKGTAELEGTGPRTVAAGAIRLRYRRGPQGRNLIEALDSVTFLQQKRYVEDLGACASASLFIRREDFWATGGFDETYKEPSGEDWEWSRRAVAEGLRIVYAEDAVVEHRALSTWSQLRRKYQRILRGNAQRWLALCQRSDVPARELEAVGPPTLAKLFRRLRKVMRDRRLNRRECLGVAALQILVWPGAMAEWRRATRALSRKGAAEARR